MSVILLPSGVRRQPTPFAASLKRPGFWRLVDIQDRPLLGTAAATATRTLNATAALKYGMGGAAVDFAVNGDWISYGADTNLQLSSMTGIAVVEMTATAAYSVLFNTNVGGVSSGGFVIRVDTTGTVTALKLDIVVIGTTTKKVRKAAGVSTVVWSYNNTTGSLRIAIDGTLQSFTSVQTFTHNTVGRNRYYSANSTQAQAHKQYLLALSASTEVSDPELVDWSLNPWQIFKAPARRIWAAASVGAYTLTASPGAFSVTGAAASLRYGRSLSASSGAFTVTGTAATLKKGYGLQAAAGSFSVSGTAASLKYGRALSATAGSFQISGTSASLKYGRVILAQPGAFQVTGTDATLIYGTAGNYTLIATPGSFGVTGAAASLKYGRSLSAGSGSFAFTGTASSLRYARQVIAEAGSFAVTGTSAILSKSAGAVSASRTFTVPAEGRVYTIQSENRTYTVTL